MAGRQGWGEDGREYTVSSLPLFDFQAKNFVQTQSVSLHGNLHNKQSRVAGIAMHPLSAVCLLQFSIECLRRGKLNAQTAFGHQAAWSSGLLETFITQLYGFRKLSSLDLSGPSLCLENL